MPLDALASRHLLRGLEHGQVGHAVGLELRGRLELMVPAIATEIEQGNDTNPPYQQGTPFPKIRKEIARIALQDDRALAEMVYKIGRSFILFMMNQINVEEDLSVGNLPDVQLYQYIRERVDYYANIEIQSLQGPAITIDDEGQVLAN